MNRWFLTLVLSVGVLAAAPAAPASAQGVPERAPPTDHLLDAKQGKRTGTVLSADYEKIVYTEDKTRKRVEIPSAEVAEIVWGDAPQGYGDGVRALASGAFEQARDGFTDAIREKGVKPDLREWIVEYANAGLGEAQLKLGKADLAADAFAGARGANAKSRLLDRILLGLAEAELARGKGDAAAKAADDLIAAAKAAKKPSWEGSAYLVKAKGKLQAGDYAGAFSAYDDAVRFAESAANVEKSERAKRTLQRTALDAAVLKGWAMVAKGEATKSNADYDAARSYFDALASKYASEPVVAASASNVAGVAKLAAGDAKGALRQFMTTEVVHFQARDEVARSLWYQAECWQRLGVEQSRQDRLKDLKESFPGSEWARRAQ